MLRIVVRFVWSLTCSPWFTFLPTKMKIGYESHSQGASSPGDLSQDVRPNRLIIASTLVTRWIHRYSEENEAVGRKDTMVSAPLSSCGDSLPLLSDSMRFHVANAPGHACGSGPGDGPGVGGAAGAVGPGPRISAMGPSHRLHGPFHGSQESSPHKGEGGFHCTISSNLPDARGRCGV